MIQKLILAFILFLAVIVVLRYLRRSLTGPACNCDDEKCPHAPLEHPGRESACASCPMKNKSPD